MAAERTNMKPGVLGQGNLDGRETPFDVNSIRGSMSDDARAGTVYDDPPRAKPIT